MAGSSSAFRFPIVYWLALRIKRPLLGPGRRWSGDVRVDSRLGEMQSPSALHVAEAAGQVVRSRRGHVAVHRADFVAAVSRGEVRDRNHRACLVDVGRDDADLGDGVGRLNFGGDADHRRQDGRCSRVAVDVREGRHRRVLRSVDTCRRRRGRSKSHQKGQGDQRETHSSHRHRLAEGLQIQ